MRGLWAVPAQDLERGRALYRHHRRYRREDWAPTGACRMLTEFDALRARAAAWSLHAGLSWDDEAIEALPRHLDGRHRRLKR